MDFKKARFVMTEPQVKQLKANSSPLEVFERMVAALNRHDLDGMVACFSRDYQSEQPFHPERNFIGQAGVRKNWGFFFTSVPNIQMDILSETIDGDTVWSETHMYGTRVDGTQHSVRGVTIQRIRDNSIIWARLYIEAPSDAKEGGLI
jgi:limonene-1,2-epoxide hydrolase